MIEAPGKNCVMVRKKNDKNSEKPDVRDLVEKSGLRHVGIIMDGNGRWAQKRALPRELGHVSGAKNFKTIVRYCKSIGIRCVTVYAFSTENWKRPEREVKALLKLLDGYIDEARDETEFDFRFIGDRSVLDPRFSERMTRLEEVTRGRLCRVNIALNYGGRSEIVHAVNEALKNGVESFDEETLSKYLYTGDSPDPDLIIRTGAECRLSNFLTWQSAYSELIFSDKMWPDFTVGDVDAAVIEFSGRKRRFGGV